MDHGSPDLVVDPVPELLANLTENPYLNPEYPPLQPDEISGFCAIKWVEGTKIYYNLYAHCLFLLRRLKQKLFPFQMVKRWKHMKWPILTPKKKLSPPVSTSLTKANAPLVRVCRWAEFKMSNLKSWFDFPLKDLGVYMSRNLTTPTRLCGIVGLLSEALEFECLYSLGFSPQCAWVWHWNIQNTSEKCFEVCLISWLTGKFYNH